MSQLVQLLVEVAREELDSLRQLLESLDRAPRSELLKGLRTIRTLRDMPKMRAPKSTEALRTLVCAECELCIDETILDAMHKVLFAADHLGWLVVADLEKYGCGRLPVESAAKALRYTAGAAYLHDVITDAIGSPATMETGRHVWHMGSTTVSLRATGRGPTVSLGERVVVHLDEVTHELLLSAEQELRQELQRAAEDRG